MSASETKKVVEDYSKHVLQEVRLAKLRGDKYIQPAHLRLVERDEIVTQPTTDFRKNHNKSKIDDFESNLSKDKLDQPASFQLFKRFPKWFIHRGIQSTFTSNENETRSMSTITKTAQTPTANIGAINLEPIISTENLWDHNSVDATLVFSSCMILLSGVMFDSGQLGSEKDGFNSVPAQLLSAWTILLILGSCAYFAAVLSTELLVALRPDLYEKIFEFKKSMSGSKTASVAAGSGILTPVSEIGKRDRNVEREADLYRPPSKDDDEDGLEMVAHMTANPLHRRKNLSSSARLMRRSSKQDALSAMPKIKSRDMKPKKGRRGSTTSVEEIDAISSLDSPKQVRTETVSSQLMSVSSTTNEAETREYVEFESKGQEMLSSSEVVSTPAILYTRESSVDPIRF
ncbi:hypothetical protein ABG067_001242 [Albugo candida]